MSSEEILTLQRRLADAKCYGGTLDGQPSEALKVASEACPDQQPQLRIEVDMQIPTDPVDHGKWVNSGV